MCQKAFYPMKPKPKSMPNPASHPPPSSSSEEYPPARPAGVVDVEIDD
jgi:hypothetical protein